MWEAYDRVKHLEDLVYPKKDVSAAKRHLSTARRELKKLKGREPKRTSRYPAASRGRSMVRFGPKRTPSRRGLQTNGRIPQELMKEWDRVSHAVRLAEKSGDYRAAEAARAEVNRVARQMENVRLGIANNVARNTMTSTMREYSAPVDEDFAEREAEARKLLRYDLTDMLDEAEARIEKAEAVVRRSGLNTTYELQSAAFSLMRAAMLAELAFGKNCEDTNSEQCYRSGELINRAQDVMEQIIRASVVHGIEQKTSAIREAAPPKKKGWFAW